jgi:hypothetical protein
MVRMHAVTLCALRTWPTGNGTQSIVWQINEEAYRARLEAEARAPFEPGLQVYYGSVHDILSFPCEVMPSAHVFDGDN